jgi:hypothetical protein
MSGRGDEGEQAGRRIRPRNVDRVSMKPPQNSSDARRVENPPFFENGW